MVLSRLANYNEQPSNTKLTDDHEGILVFTAIGEFCRNLQVEDPINGERWTEVVEGDKDELHAEEEKDPSEDVNSSISEASLGKGLAGALSLLKERGTLKKTADWGGRKMDKKRSKLVGIVDGPNNQVAQRDILLDRVDEFGRTMTPKEAFRRFSHKFHGKGPGKLKQEKTMKQYHEGLRLKQTNCGDPQLGDMICINARSGNRVRRK